MEISQWKYHNFTSKIFTVKYFNLGTPFRIYLKASYAFCAIFSVTILSKSSKNVILFS